MASERIPAAVPRDLLSGAATLAPYAVVALAFAVRLAGLGSPATLLVDERYYVAGARQLIDHGVEPSYVTLVPGEVPAVHPPLGKWLIGLGMLVAGDRPFGWRLAGALAGTATVALVYLCGRRLFPGRAPALIAAFLLAIEHLSVVQSRTAMLDVFLAMWLVAGVYALLRDRDAARARLDVGAAGGRLDRRRGWRLAAGVLFGCALATKWSGAYVLPVAVLLSLGWELGLRRQAGVRPALRRVVFDEGPSIIAAFTLIPVGVYLASHAGAFIGGIGLAAWWDNQVRVLRFHANLDAGHPYASTAWSWLVTRRPVAYFYEQSGQGVREVLALGHPLVFLASTPAAIWAAARWARFRDHALGAVLLVALSLWLPWVVQDRPMFVFYMTPLVPFVVLLQGAALARLARAGPAGAAITAVVLTAAVALFWFHWPVLTGLQLSREEWLIRVAEWGRIPLWRPDWV